MSPQKNNMIIRQEQEQLTEDEISLWTLGNPTTTLKIGSLNASIATNTGTWQKNADQRRKNPKPGNVSNVRKKNTLPRTAKEHSQ